MRRALLVLASVIVLIAPLQSVTAEAGPSPHQRATSQRNWTDWQPEKRSYFWESEKWSDKLNRCITVDLSGDWSFQWLPALDPNNQPRGYRNLKVSNARMEVFTRDSCSRASGSFKNVDSVQMKQRWSPEWVNEKDCDLNPSVSVNLPWSVSLTVTPECSSPKLKTGFFSTHPGGNDHYFFQYNDGTSILIDKETNNNAPFCYNVDASVVVYNSTPSGSGSDSVPPFDKRICTHRDDSKCPGDPTCQSSPRNAGRLEGRHH